MTTGVVVLHAAFSTARRNVDADDHVQIRPVPPVPTASIASPPYCAKTPSWRSNRSVLSVASPLTVALPRAKSRVGVARRRLPEPGEVREPVRVARLDVGETLHDARLIGPVPPGVERTPDLRPDTDPVTGQFPSLAPQRSPMGDRCSGW
jgi:hypothetical protein